jgi:large subunit ribosomal protein L24e
VDTILETSPQERKGGRWFQEEVSETISRLPLTYLRSRRAVKVQRAIVGASLEELKKKRQTTKTQSVATESALKEVRTRQKGAAAAATTGGSKHYSTGPAVPKIQRGNANARGGVKR